MAILTVTNGNNSTLNESAIIEYIIGTLPFNAMIDTENGNIQVTLDSIKDIFDMRDSFRSMEFVDGEGSFELTVPAVDFLKRVINIGMTAIVSGETFDSLLAKLDAILNP